MDANDKQRLKDISERYPNSNPNGVKCGDGSIQANENQCPLYTTNSVAQPKVDYSYYLKVGGVIAIIALLISTLVLTIVVLIKVTKKSV